MYSSHSYQEGGIVLKLVKAFLIIVKCILRLIQFHINLAQVQEHIHCAEVLQSRLELSLSITIQS